MLKNLAPVEAQLFNSLIKNSFRRAGAWCPMAAIPTEQSWLERNAGLTFEALERLQDAGLITVYEVQRGLLNQTEVLLEGSGYALRFYSEIGPIGVFTLGQVTLTVPGSELAKICEWNIHDTRTEEMVRYIHSGFKVEKIVTDAAGKEHRSQLR